MMGNLNYRQYFLRILIAALTVSALIGMFIFLAGDFGETEIRLLLTTLAIGGYSLTGLCSSTIYSINQLKIFSSAGMMVAVTGFLITAGAIWDVVDIDDVWKIMIIFMILSASIAHSSLLLHIKPRTRTAGYLLAGTIGSIAIVALMLIKSIITEFDEGEFYFRLLGVFSILDVLGTITSPILNKIQDKAEIDKDSSRKLIANTPAPPYYAAIFSSVRTDVDAGYAEMAELMFKLAGRREGFLGFESARNELGITISYWRDLESIKKWKEHSEHIIAQEKGKTEWYKQYKIRIANVERDYGFNKES